MADPTDQGKPKLFSRRYLLDRASQLPFAGLVLTVLIGIGTLYAAAVWFLADTHLLRDATVGEMRLVLLLVHTGYGLIGGGILFAAVVLLTHRFVGPAYVMRRAVHRMRHGDFGGRLRLRRNDYLKDCAEELRLLRDELAEQADVRTLAYERLDAMLAAGQIREARDLVAELRRKPAADEDAAAA